MTTKIQRSLQIVILSIYAFLIASSIPHLILITTIIVIVLFSENVTRIWEASSKFGTSEILSLEHYDMLNYDDNKNNSNDDDDDSENTEEVLIVAFTNGRIELYKYDQHKYPLLMYETVSDRYVKKFCGDYLYVESLITVETFIKN